MRRGVALWTLLLNGVEQGSMIGPVGDPRPAIAALTTGITRWSHYAKPYEWRADGGIVVRRTLLRECPACSAAPGEPCAATAKSRRQRLGVWLGDASQSLHSARLRQP